MLKFFNNPWVIGVGTIIIATIILWLIEMIKILFLGNKKLKPVTDTKDNRAFNLNIANLQKQKFEENKKNYLDPRNSNR